MRLNRFLSASGVSSRRKGEEIIAAGRVRVNGTVATDPAFAVDPGEDIVEVDGSIARISATRRYIVLNKPTGVIVSRGDTHGRRTVYDLLGVDAESLFPVGRLDADTSGVLLLTDDGDLTYRLTHPSFGVNKRYRAVVEGAVMRETVDRFHRGLSLEDGMTAPADLRIISRGDNTTEVEVVLHEGRNRQVRRMFYHVGHAVRTLERVSFGGVTAEDMKTGAVRPLTKQEIRMLRDATGQSGKGEANGSV